MARAASLASAGELALVERLAARFPGSGRGGAVGIGDDAAVCTPDPGGRTLLTTDVMVEGVHFDLGLTTPRQLGFKLVSVNVSDLYAMGGRPRHLLLTFALPRQTTLAFFDALLDGVAEAAARYGVSVVGGDLSGTSGPMNLGATALGYASKPILRSTARPGDAIYVTGPLGDSAAGLAVLGHMAHARIRPADVRSERMKLPAGLPAWGVARPCVERHLCPVARRPSAAMVRAATAMIDLSDGLLIDLGRLTRASGAGARVELGRVPVSGGLAAVASALGLDPLGLALGGGEDYELLYTARPGVRMPGRRIGRITAEPGLTGVDKAGRARRLKAEGYTHFGGG
jgi:thiamine-monophosphate kinase